MTRPDPSLSGQRGVRSILRIGGPVLVVIGLGLTLMGLGSFFAAMGSFGEMPGNFWMAFIGLPLLAVGAMMSYVGYLGPATRYVAGEVTPTIRDTLGALGLSSTVRCSACGASNDADARFCDGCGAALNLRCSACAASNDADARFCDGCGTALPPAGPAPGP